MKRVAAIVKKMLSSMAMKIKENSIGNQAKILVGKPQAVGLIFFKVKEQPS